MSNQIINAQIDACISFDKSHFSRYYTFLQDLIFLFFRRQRLIICVSLAVILITCGVIIVVVVSLSEKSGKKKISLYIQFKI